MRPVRIRVKKDACMALAQRFGFAFAKDGFELLTLCAAELDMMRFLGHRSHLYTDNNSTSYIFADFTIRTRRVGH
jgi:hypothetical protein